MTLALEQPAVVGALIGATVAFVAAIASLWVGILNWRQSRRSYGSTVHARIEDLYDRLVDYRLKHPEVFRLSRSWQPACIAKIYSQSDDEEKTWVVYFGYVELCVSFCNATLHARNRGLLDSVIYRDQLEPLVKLLVTEHLPAIKQITDEGFASKTLVQFIAEMRQRGWNWPVRGYWKGQVTSALRTHGVVVLRLRHDPPLLAQGHHNQLILREI